jgi:hypothetical protein
MAPPTYTSALIVGAGQRLSASLSRLLRKTVSPSQSPRGTPQSLRRCGGSGSCERCVGHYVEYNIVERARRPSLRHGHDSHAQPLESLCRR